MRRAPPSLPVPRCTTTVTAMKPDDSMSRSPRVASPTSPVMRPSTNILPTGTAPAIDATPFDQVDADAVLGQHDVLLGHPGAHRQLGVGAQMPPGAVHRHHVARPHPVVEEQQLAGVGVARNVHARLGVGDHAGADLGQRVDDAVDRLLVAGDQRRRQDDQIARGQRDAAVLTARHPRQRRHRLALGSGGDQHDPVGGSISAAAMSITSSSATVEEAQFPGDAHVAHHGPADERHLAAQSHCGVDDLLHAVDVGGEARDDHAAVGTADQPVQVRPDLALRRADARDARRWSSRTGTGPRRRRRAATCRAGRWAGRRAAAGRA